MLELKAQEKVDWFRVLDDLNRRDWSTRRISANIDVPRSTLIGWKAGSCPDYEKANRLIWLWVEVNEKPESELPIYNPSPPRRLK